MKKTIPLLAIFLCEALCPTDCFAQSDNFVNRMMPKPIPTSPNVASLGKFGDYQVSHFSGLPEISIPIAEAKSGSLSIPITLSYHAGGIKPTDAASWVGLGWSLSTGGQISRTVNGKNDEQGYSSTALNPDPRICGPAGTGTFYYLLQAADGTIDTEPDVFSYSFGGRSGKFLWTYNSVPYLVPYAPLNITTSPGFGKFEITDERGVLHRFGQNGQGTSWVEATTATNGGNPSMMATTAWPLTEMIAPNADDKITISYQSVGTFQTHDISWSYAVMDQCYANSSGTCPTNTFQANRHDIDSYGTQNGPDIISFETGKIKFHLSTTNRTDDPGLKYLDRIEVQRLDGTVVKTIKFIYTYFTGASGGSAALKLDEVRFLDNAGAVTQKYRFDYFTNSFSWDKGDNSDLNARDLWGFYNGATSNTDLLLPRTISYTEGGQTTNLTFGGATDRAVNTQYIKEGVLRKIYLPTGGYTEFDYEANAYLKEGTPTLAGGLRVKSITSSDGGTAPPVVKTYKYGSGSSLESGYGLPNFTELQFNYSGAQQIFQGSECGNGTNSFVQYQLRTFHSNSAFSTDPFDSSPIKYPYVTEYFGEPGGPTNGRILYQYDNGNPANDVNHVVPSSGKYFRNSFFWKRGKLTRKIVYDANGNKLLETVIQHSALQETSKYVGLGVHHFVPSNYTCLSGMTCTNEVGEPIASNAFFFTTYHLNTGVLLESVITEYAYENDNTAKYVAKSKSTSYEATNLQPVLQSTSANNGQTYRTVNRYPFQLSATSASTGTAKGIHMLNTKHILSTPIETYTYLDKGSIENMLSAQVTTFRQNEVNPAYVIPDEVYVWEAKDHTVDRSTYSESAVNAGNNGITMDEDLKPRIKMARYSAEGDIMTAAPTDLPARSYQYGYNKALPVAEVTNALNTRYGTSVQTTAQTPFTVGGVTPVTSQPITFTVDYQGTVTLKLGVSGTPSFTTYAEYSGSLGTGSMPLNTGSCTANEVIFNNVTPGEKTIYITLMTEIPGTTATACGHVEYPYTQTTLYGVAEFFHQNFEEGPFATSPLVAHTGSGYLNGDYSPTFVIPNSRSYTIEYWYWNGSSWVYESKPYTGTSTPVNEGTAIDDIRIYPTDAMMKTYTYDPLWGITSVIDESGVVTYYNYDAFGRLANIRNDKGEVEKSYTYHYRGN